MVNKEIIKGLKILTDGASYKEPMSTQDFARKLYGVDHVSTNVLVVVYKSLEELRKQALVNYTFDNPDGWYILRNGREEIIKYENQKAETI